MAAPVATSSTAVSPRPQTTGVFTESPSMAFVSIVPMSAASAVTIGRM
jgi:hypothetical protein